MKAVCVSNFNYYDKRIRYIQSLLEKKGYEVHYITGDYDTMNRQLYTLDIPRVKQIPIIQYEKNISIQRIRSHYEFAKATYLELEQLQPDIIYAMVPPNFVPYFISKYKKKYPHTQVIYDVFDMWPETFPSKYKKLLAMPFALWEKIRTVGLRQADAILTECQYFADHLNTSHQKLPKARSLYPCQLPSTEMYAYNEQNDEFGICYLGSINNIIDIAEIERLLSEIAQVKTIHLHIIGNGEKQDEFVERMRQVCHRVTVYGNVYDAKEKQTIFNQCAFGLNILKPSVFIGLTLKTIDYLNGGLPLLSNVVGDTKFLIEGKQCGIHVPNILNLSECIADLTLEQIRLMKYNAREVFNQYFDATHFTEQLEQTLIDMGIKL